MLRFSSKKLKKSIRLGFGSWDLGFRGLARAYSPTIMREHFIPFHLH